MTFNLENSVAALKDASARLDAVVARDHEKYSKLGHHLDLNLLSATRPPSHAMQSEIQDLHGASDVSRKDIQDLVIWFGYLIQDTLSPAFVEDLQRDGNLKEAGDILGELNQGELEFTALPLEQTGERFGTLYRAFGGLMAFPIAIAEAMGNTEKQNTLAYSLMHIIAVALHNIITVVDEHGIPAETKEAAK